GVVNIVDFARISKEGFSVETTSQFSSLTIQHLAASRTGIDGSELLISGASGKLLMLSELELYEAAADYEHPQDQRNRDIQNTAIRISRMFFDGGSAKGH